MKGLFKKWWFWILLIIIVIFFFAPVFNCKNVMGPSPDVVGMRCQSIFDILIHGPQEQLF